VALFAENPRDGVNDIRFAAAVGSDNAGHAAAAEDDVGLLAERLETKKFDFAKFEHAAPWEIQRADGTRKIQVKFIASRAEFRDKSVAGREERAQPPGALERR